MFMPKYIVKGLLEIYFSYELFKCTLLKTLCFVNFIGLGEVPLEIIFLRIVVSLFSSIHFSIWKIQIYSWNFLCFHEEFQSKNF